MASIFVSYRIADSAAHAGRLADALKARFGRDAVFLAADDLPQGSRWHDELIKQLRDCRVLLAVIGPQWGTALDAMGDQRLSQADDVVRMEIREGLAQKKPTLPVLVAGARLPAAATVPSDIRALLERNRVEVRDDHWDSDLEAVVRDLVRLEPILRGHVLMGRFASRTYAATLVTASAAGLAAGHVLLVRLDIVDAYSLRILPYVLVLAFATIIMVHAVARLKR